MILSIVLAVIVVSVLVVSHEFGHFLLAKKNGIGVVEFSVGMGPRILSKEKGGTRYSLKAIPFGGSCQMVGEDEEDDSEDSFNKKSPFARFAVVLGGPVFNFILAWILAVIVLSLAGVNEPRVYYVSEGYGAEAAGIQEGDLITAIDGHRVVLGRDIELYFLNHPMDGSPIEITYERDGESHTVTLDPSYESLRTGFSIMLLTTLRRSQRWRRIWIWRSWARRWEMSLPRWTAPPLPAAMSWLLILSLILFRKTRR